MGRQRLSALSAPLAGARFYGPARLSVPPVRSLPPSNPGPGCGNSAAGTAPGSGPANPPAAGPSPSLRKTKLPRQIPAPLVKAQAGPKLVGHGSRAATASEAPARPAPKPAAPTVAGPRQRGRPKQGEARPVPPPSIHSPPAAVGGPETRGQIRRHGRSVFAKSRKQTGGVLNRIFHHSTPPAHLAVTPPIEVLKLRQD
jgi:hypothetical protein